MTMLPDRTTMFIACMVLLLLASVALCSGLVAEERHPAAGELDPYAGFARMDGASCCGSKDCHPAPYDGHSGLVGLPDGTWVDPWGVDVARYSSFDGRAHVCITRGKLQCVFIPGAAASIASP